ncbi:MAG TPA: D-alanyl-D-alanine carboxypeptidase/D-alanyl-D-alanine-endopeptidase [Acidimicrobiales bacterium]|nr:D-alanyl-D-alanine carboxypeptidase/D-alanyl-D-alanine-endopeptidase [Acidimicrobiales bacterium]
MTPRQRRLTVALSSLVALVSTGAALATSTAGAGADFSGAAPRAAVLSPRRAPEFLHRVVAETRLASRVQTLMRSLPPASCVVIRADESAILTVNPGQLLIPASALKLTTAAAFLREAGGKGRFSTRVGGRRPNGSGVVDGDLILEGGGDPLLATPGYVETRKHPPKPATDFSRLITALRDAGVRRVTGGIGVYDGIFDAERRVPTWSSGYTAAGDVGPIGALVVDDGFSAYSPHLIAAPDPAMAAGASLRAALAAAGVTVDGPTFRTNTPATSALATVESVPYAEVVAEMLRESDNNTAELLLKTLAHRDAGAPGTRVRGVAARLEALADLGLDAAQVQAIDGSGLDRGDRTTCGALIGTLTTRPGGYDLEDMLAIAGRTGTLDDRFTTSRLAGRLRAKTGSLGGVTALVGVADPKAAIKLRFAFVSNGSFSDDGGKALQDRLVAALATFPEAPSAAGLAP